MSGVEFVALLVAGLLFVSCRRYWPAVGCFVAAGIAAFSGLVR